MAGKIIVKNRDDRFDSYKVNAERAIAKGSMSPTEDASLQGRLVHGEAQLFGRVSAIMMPEFRKCARGKESAAIMSEAVATELRWMVSHFHSAIPRKLVARDTRLPLNIFTDAALEGFETVATVGAVVFDRSVRLCVNEHFGEVAPSNALGVLLTTTTRVIAVLEVFPVLLALIMWASRCLHRREFVFIDNDAARASLTNCSSTSEVISNVLKLFITLTAENQCFLWNSRVPSDSNIADGPSRLEFTGLKERNRRSPDFGVLQVL